MADNGTPAETNLLNGFSGTDIEYAKISGGVLIITSVLTGESVQFPAYLKDFSQNFTSTWNEVDVFGRNDPIATFQNTKRKMSLGWDVPAGNMERAKLNLETYSKLTKMLYPAYNPTRTGAGAHATTLSHPPLVKIKFANLIDDSANSGEGLLGYLNDLSMTPALEMGFFTTGGTMSAVETGTTQEAGQIYPKVFSLSCGFNVLHQHSLGITKPEKKWASASDKFPFI